MKTCLFCKKEIEDYIAVCPYCGSSKFDGGSVFVDYQTPSGQTQNSSSGTKKKSKKGLALAIILVLMFAPIVISMITSMIPCKHEYKEEVMRQATYSRSGESKFTCEKCHDSYTEEIPMLLSVEVEVLDKYTYYEKADPNVMSLDQKYILMEIEIKNVTDKDIKSVEGCLKINSDTTYVTTDCTFEDEVIPVGESIIVKDYGFSTRKFGLLDYDDDAEKIYITPHEKLTYEFVVTDITYAD